MTDYHLSEMEACFAELIWEAEPVRSGKLVELCREKLNWAKPTTYTVLRKLCQKELFVNEGGTVRALLSREEYAAVKSEQFVKKYYQGSLPAFLAAFASRRELSEEEAAELRRMLNDCGK